MDMYHTFDLDLLKVSCQQLTLLGLLACAKRIYRVGVWPLFWGRASLLSYSSVLLGLLKFHTVAASKVAVWPRSERR